MRRCFFFLSICILFCLPLVGQNNFGFLINGHIDADTGLIVLLPAGDESYYETLDFNQNIQVKGGKFTIRGRISYPLALKLGFKQKGEFIYLSGLFFIEPGTQSISCQIDSLRVSPAINNKTMHE